MRFLDHDCANSICILRNIQLSTCPDGKLLLETGHANPMRSFDPIEFDYSDYSSIQKPWYSYRCTTSYGTLLQQPCFRSIGLGEHKRFLTWKHCPCRSPPLLRWLLEAARLTDASPSTPNAAAARRTVISSRGAPRKHVAELGTIWLSGQRPHRPHRWSAIWTSHLSVWINLWLKTARCFRNRTSRPRMLCRQVRFAK